MGDKKIMDMEPNEAKDKVEELKHTYQEGDRVELVSVEDTYTDLEPGEQGSVRYVGSDGTVYIRWDSGSGLGLIYGVDKWKKVEGGE